MLPYMYTVVYVKKSRSSLQMQNRRIKDVQYTTQGIQLYNEQTFASTVSIGRHCLKKIIAEYVLNVQALHNIVHPFIILKKDISIYFLPE